MSKGNSLTWNRQVCCPSLGGCLSATKPAWAVTWDAHLALCKSRGSNLCLQEPRAPQSQPLAQECREQGWADSTARQLKVETGEEAGGKEGRWDCWICSPRPWGGLGGRASRGLALRTAWGKPTRDQGAGGLECHLFSQHSSTSAVWVLAASRVSELIPLALLLSLSSPKACVRRGQTLHGSSTFLPPLLLGSWAWTQLRELSDFRVLFWIIFWIIWIIFDYYSEINC